MKVRGIHGNKTSYVLIDLGSTYNFIDKKVVEMLGCKIKEAGRTKVSVADGNQITVCGRVDDFRWKFQGDQFLSDFMVIPLGGHDVVLGVQWLARLGPITWNFDKLEMRFKWEQQKVVLNGLRPGSVREVKFNKKDKSGDSTMQLNMIYTYENTEDSPLSLRVLSSEAGQKSLKGGIERLRHEYGDIFIEPTSLPPFKTNHNHKIVLKEDLTR